MSLQSGLLRRFGLGGATVKEYDSIFEFLAPGGVHSLEILVLGELDGGDPAAYGQGEVKAGGVLAFDLINSR